MSKNEFMQKLNDLLLDLPENERREAIQYYNDYFEDAGVENEQQVLAELDSPEKVAIIIRTDLLEGDSREGDGKEYTETGFSDLRFEDKGNMPDNIQNFYEEGKNWTSGEDIGYNNNESRVQAGQGDHYQHRSENEYNGQHYHNNSYNQDGDYRGRPNNRSANNIGKIILVILVLIFGFPVIMPVVGIVFGILVSIIIVPLVLTIALVLTGIGLILFGIPQFVSFPAIGFAICGAGLVVVGLGLLALLCATLVFGKFLPWVGRTLSARLHSSRRGGMTV